MPFSVFNGKKQAPHYGFPQSGTYFRMNDEDRKSVQRNDFIGLQAFGSVGDNEFDFLTFLDGTVSIDFDRTVMEKDISAGSPFNESIALGIVEPLDFAFFFFGHFDTTFFLFLHSPMQEPAFYNSINYNHFLNFEKGVHFNFLYFFWNSENISPWRQSRAGES